jgi:16S rRNA (cytosine1402-N4)-methyltransferase
MVGSKYHVPVLLKEAIDYLKVEPGKKYLDATLGGGGHSLEIVRRGGELLAIDRDPEAIEFAKLSLAKACPDLPPPKLAQGNFSELDKIAHKAEFTPVDGIIFDLGVSSHQLETLARGFSFNQPGPLDMRMDPGLTVRAEDLINALGEKELAELFIKFGEEKLARRYAKAIVGDRRTQKISSTEALAKIIWEAAPVAIRRGRIHPATQVFQALRIAVNDELNALSEALPKAVSTLKKDGRLVVISFHSLEDGRVKRFFNDQEEAGVLTIITEKPIEPSQEEVARNSRARSAKMRVAEKR